MEPDSVLLLLLLVQMLTPLPLPLLSAAVAGVSDNYGGWL